VNKPFFPIILYSLLVPSTNAFFRLDLDFVPALPQGACGIDVGGAYGCLDVKKL
jgi:hypothetical protein